MITWEKVGEERYCVDSGRPVQLIPGDRCRSHGARGVMCTTAVRDPRCEHPRLSPNHRYPKCSECGRSGRADHSFRSLNGASRCMAIVGLLGSGQACGLPPEAHQQPADSGF